MHCGRDPRLAMPLPVQSLDVRLDIVGEGLLPKVDFQALASRMEADDRIERHGDSIEAHAEKLACRRGGRGGARQTGTAR